MAKEEQGAEKGSEDIQSNAMKGFPDGVGISKNSPFPPIPHEACEE